jgi:hypothetical protein
VDFFAFSARLASHFCFRGPVFFFFGTRQPFGTLLSGSKNRARFYMQYKLLIFQDLMLVTKNNGPKNVKIFDLAAQAQYITDSSSIKPAENAVSINSNPANRWS